MVNVDRFAVGIGDSYQDGKFMRNGEEIPRLLTADERLAQLEAEKAAMQKQLDDLSVLVLQQGGALIG